MASGALQSDHRADITNTSLTEHIRPQMGKTLFYGSVPKAHYTAILPGDRIIVAGASSSIGDHWWSSRIHFLVSEQTISLTNERLYKARWVY